MSYFWKQSRTLDKCIYIYIYPWFFPFAGGHTGVVWGGDDDVPCAWTHLWCYGDDVVPCTWTHLWCYGALGWGGVGWGGDDDVPCTWTHLWCYGDDDVPCTWTHLWCYGEWGGDNRAESRLGQIKATMRRCGALKGHYSLLVQIQKNSSSRCCSIAQKAWHNVSAECFAAVQKWL